METRYKIHQYDARKISEIITDAIVDVTITSPPYFDMKDYGYKEQIGFGQNYEDYLNDLRTVFSNVYKCTKNSGTLWVIIDAFKRGGSVVPLPFDFANKISEVGWHLQEIIIWEKDKTVPWVHKGQMRNLFEYILVFAKSTRYRFHIDRVRQYDSLKKWWIKYPERYNPKGKTPEAIWRFPIPVQGSWGDNYIRHFCPLPEDLIAQILRITTDEGDVVLDPFAGSGAVLAKADNMKRRYIGTELNPEYISMFQTYMRLTKKDKEKQYEQEELMFTNQSSFEKLIKELRILKYARVLFSKLSKDIQEQIQMIFVEKSTEKLKKENSIISAHYTIEIGDLSKECNIIEFISSIITKPPLSKFGIEPIFIFSNNGNVVKNHTKLYTYTKTATHKYYREIDIGENISLSKSELIISPIKVQLNENDFE